MALPPWPPDWVETWPLGETITLGVTDGVVLISAERADGQVLMALTWPEGRRWIRIDPSGEEPPETFRAGELAEDNQLARQIDALWSQALRVAKMLIDGEADKLAELVAQAQGEEPKKRFWRRG